MKTTPEIPVRGFTGAEFASRVQRAQRAMREYELDALLVTTPPNIRYFSGFDTQFWESPTRPWFLVVPGQGEPIAVIPEIAAPQFAQTWVQTIYTWPAPRPADDGISLLGSVLSSLPRSFGRVGAELGREMSLRMPVLDFERLRKETRDLAFVDGAQCLWSVRQIKSPAEVDHIRHVCRIACDVFENLPLRISPGMSEREIAALFRIDLIERGADSVPFLPVISGPGGVEQIVCGPRDRILTDGDLLFIDTGATYDGYFCDFDRIYGVGKVSDQAKWAHDRVWRASEAGIEFARPGKTVEELWREMQRVLDEGREQATSNVGRSGHGLGLQLTEPPSNMPGDQTVLREGMVMTIEPGIEYAKGQMIVHEENIVITADGAELLTRRAPREMWTIG